MFYDLGFSNFQISKFSKLLDIEVLNSTLLVIYMTQNPNATKILFIKFGCICLQW